MTLPLIVAAHLAILLWMATLPPKPVPNAFAFMDVALIDGAGGESSIGDVPTPDDKDSEAEAEPEAQTEQAEPQEAEPTVQTPTPAEQTPTEDVSETDTVALDEPLGQVPPPDPTQPNVLAMVEQIIGVQSSEIAAPPNQTTALSELALLQLRAQKARAGGGCAIEALLDERLTSDAEVQTSLAGVQRDLRSVSNAIQLWDGDWIPMANSDGTDPLIVVRAVITDAVENAPAQCRNQTVTGPRFFLVSTVDDGATVLVMGSGEWRWRDLLPERPPGLFNWFAR